MYDKVNIDDLRTFFQGTVCLHKNRPVFVQEISANRSFMMTDLLSQKRIVDREGDKNVQGIQTRLGMVNANGTIYYLFRNPLRRMSIGISGVVVSIKRVAGQNQDIDLFKSVGLGECLLNKYPTFVEALDIVKDFDSYCVAFDKQFAVNTDRQVFYKTKHVANVQDDKIVFLPTYEQYGALLYEPRPENLSSFKEIPTD